MGYSVRIIPTLFICITTNAFYVHHASLRGSLVLMLHQRVGIIPTLSIYPTTSLMCFPDIS
jgi:hypothetical protein